MKQLAESQIKCFFFEKVDTKSGSLQVDKILLVIVHNRKQLRTSWWSVATMQSRFAGSNNPFILCFTLLLPLRHQHYRPRVTGNAGAAAPRQLSRVVRACILFLPDVAKIGHVFVIREAINNACVTISFHMKVRRYIYLEYDETAKKSMLTQTKSRPQSLKCFCWKARSDRKHWWP